MPFEDSVRSSSPALPESSFSLSFLRRDSILLRKLRVRHFLVFSLLFQLGGGEGSVGEWSLKLWMELLKAGEVWVGEQPGGVRWAVTVWPVLALLWRDVASRSALRSVRILSWLDSFLVLESLSRLLERKSAESLQDHLWLSFWKAHR